jgi:DNA-binding NarL/FixJ family response regulator
VRRKLPTFRVPGSAGWRQELARALPCGYGIVGPTLSQEGGASIPIAVVLVERDARLRARLREKLGADAGISVLADVGAASTGARLALQRPVRVLVLGSSVRRDDVFAALDTVREQAPGIRCLVLMHDHDQAEQHRVLMAGAAGVLLAETTPGQLPDAVHALNADEAVVPPPLVASLLRRFRRARTSQPATRPVREPLSSREWQVLNELAAGRTTAAAAEHLGIALATVHSHLRNIYGKLGVSSRTEALAAAEYLRSQRRPGASWRSSRSDRGTTMA